MYTLNGTEVHAVCYAIDQQGGKGGANYLKDICPKILSDSHGTPHAVACIGIDLYNQTMTGGVSKTLNNRATDSDHVPCVLIRGGLAVHQNGSGEVQMSEVGYTVSTSSNASGRNTPLVLVLNDQGGAVMRVSYDVTSTLRSQTKHHEPVVLVYESHNQDSRYNPLGEVCETVSAKYGTGGATSR